MKYHLTRDGKNLGMFPIEELQRWRASGELSGKEYVWREGMAEWQRIDVVLATVATYQPTPPPIPMARAKRSMPVWAAGLAIAGGVVFIGLVVVAAWAASVYFRQTKMSGEPEGMEFIPKEAIVSVSDATEADVMKRGGDFRRHAYLEGYKENGSRDPAWDTEVIDFLEAWIEAFFGSGTSDVDIATWSDKLAAMPEMNDPLVLTIAAINSTELFEAMKRLDRALALYPESKHKAYPQFCATVNLINRTRETAKLNVLFPSSVDLFQQALADGSIRPEDQAEIAETLVNGWGKDYFGKIGSQVHGVPRQAGDAFEWLALVLEGEFQVAEAWRARGGGYSHTVTQEGWRAFASHLAEARSAYAAAWKLRPDLPLAPSRMVYIAMSQSSEDMGEWFERALAAQVDYPEAWESMRWALRPRWHGGYEAMVALGKYAVDTGRFDTDAPRKFLDVVADLESEMNLSPGEHIYGRPEIWPHLRRMYEGYIAEPARPGAEADWRSAFAVIAYFTAEYDAAREQLEAIDFRPTTDLSGWGTDLSLMPLEVAARTGAAPDQIALAEVSYNRADIPSAIQRFEEIAAAPDLDPLTEKFAASRLAALELEQELMSGEWVDFLPAATNDLSWEVSLGTLTSAGNGAVEVRSGKSGHMLYHRGRVGPSFEIRGEFEVAESSTDDFQAGLVMGMPNFGGRNWYGFRMKRNLNEGQVASFAQGWSRKQILKTVYLDPKTNSFEFRLFEGRVTASVNGELVFQRAARPKSSVRVVPNEFYAGFGAYNDMNDSVIRYKNVQIRRLQ